jgi:hypothetical protein
MTDGTEFRPNRIVDLDPESTAKLAPAYPGVMRENDGPVVTIAADTGLAPGKLAEVHLYRSNKCAWLLR